MKTLRERWLERAELDAARTDVHPLVKRERKAPEPRHACAYCDRPVSNGLRNIELSAVDPERVFCRLRCAAAFGIAAHRHGLRLKK